MSDRRWRVPFSEEELRGHHSGAHQIAVVQQLEETSGLAGRQGRHPEVIQDEQIGLVETPSEYSVAAVQAGERDL